MPAGSRAILAITLAVALLGGALVGHATAGPSHQQVSPDSDATLTMTVDLQPDGDARWRVSTTFDLSSEAERESFGELAESFENGETSALGLPAFRRASGAASQATGREMSIRDVQRRSSVENDTGRLTAAFTWTNFAQTEGDRLYVDDVFATGPNGETWLPGLDPGDRFVVRAPEGYGVVAASVPPESRDNRSLLQWTGPATFEPDDLRAEFTGRADTPTPTPASPGPQGSVPWLMVVGLGLGGGVVAVYLLARRSDGSPSPSPAREDDEPGGESPPSTADDAALESGSADAETETGDGTETAAGAGVDEELLSDEERVERLLERNGGRMKQATIVKETGWSNAKVSQLLSAMEENGRVDKLRIGRENLISFPDEDVTDTNE